MPIQLFLMPFSYQQAILHEKTKKEGQFKRNIIEFIC